MKKNENHWDELFSEMEVNINVEAHIRGRIAQLFLPFYETPNTNHYPAVFIDGGNGT